jgi:hypothetical protein
MSLNSQSGHQAAQAPSGNTAPPVAYNSSETGPHRIFDLKTISVTILLSVVYFADVMWRASRKPFWFDELFTVYLCRLPSLKSTWIAVQHGADFNPPLFYLFTRMSEAVFGEGAIATRLPQMIGVWLFCLCLFVFIARRLGRVAGLIASAFPLLTLALYYGYEARPHGITLGWCGLALLCWQRIVEGGNRAWWNIAFLLVMLGSMLTHVYAVYLIVPFALFEAYGLLSGRKIHWGIVAGLLIPLAIVVPIFLPMVHTYKAMLPAIRGGTGILPAALLHFTQETLGPSVFVLLLFLVLLCFGTFLPRPIPLASPRQADQAMLRLELVLAVSFLALPIFGVLGISISHAGFFTRYFLSAVAGVAILFAYGSATLLTRRSGQLLAAFMLLLISCDLAWVAYNVVRGNRDNLVEPSSRLNFPTAPDRVMDYDDALLHTQSNLPILDINEAKYLYLFRYAPQSIVQRLYFGAPTSSDPFLKSYQALETWGHVALRPTDFADFFSTHDHFYVYGSGDEKLSECGSCADMFLRAGYKLIGETRGSEEILYEYSR